MFEVDYNVSAEEIVEGYDHVHHAMTVRLLEFARLRFLEAIGFPIEALMKRGEFLVISRIEVDYKREIFEGPIWITCESPRIEGRKIVLNQTIFNQKGKAAIDAIVYSIFMSGETRRGMDVPADFAQAFQNQ
jgi:YbgC/YbaW family acyl-CoA thioester hydrolase